MKSRNLPMTLKAIAGSIAGCRLLLQVATVFCLLSAVAVPTQAQSFGPPVPSRLILVLLDRAGNPRFTLSAYSAYWENPFRVTVRTVSDLRLSLGWDPLVSRTVKLVGKRSASPLMESTYALSHRWAVGFWYNPIHDRGEPELVQIVDVPKVVALSRDADLGDLHVIYYGPRGLSAQVGYYYERGTYHVRTNDPVPNPRYQMQRADYKLGSWNLWLTQRVDARAGGRLITPFVSAGYHSSSSLRHAVSVLTGAALTFNERLSLSGSVWLFDLSNPATRVTSGLVYRF